jgi:transposase
MFSKDIINLACKLYKQYKNYETVSSIIDVSKSTIQRWVSNLDYYLKPKEKQTRQRKITNTIINFIIDLVENNKQIQLKELKNLTLNLV